MISFEYMMSMQGYDLAQADRQIQADTSMDLQEKFLRIQAFWENKSQWYSAKKGEILDKTALREFYAHHAQVGDCYQGKTSGSSGQALMFYKDKPAHAITWAVIQKAYAKLGLKFNDLEARFYAIHAKGPARWKEKHKDWLMKRHRFDVATMEDEDLAGYLKTLKRKPFKYLYGYTQALYRLALYLKKNQIVLASHAPSLRLAIVTAEQCSSEMKVTMEKHFGFPVRVEYGCSETGLIAMEQSDGRMKVMNEQLMLEVVDEQGNPVPEGETGQLLVTAFYNKATPFIRYAIGDVGAVVNEGQQQYITKLQGRVNELIHTPSGKKVQGFTLYYIIKDLLQLYPSIESYQWEQFTPQGIGLKVSSSLPLPAEWKSKAQEFLNAYMGEAMTIEAQQVEEIPLQPNHKFKHFISHV